jgi:hypothetical protein
MDANMALPSENFPRPRLLPTVPEAVVLTSVSFEDATNKRVIHDFHSTVNAAVRLAKRLIITPVYEGADLKLKIETQDYSANANSVYDPASLTTATTAPFTIDPTKVTLVGTTPATNLDAVYTAAGDART